MSPIAPGARRRRAARSLGDWRPSLLRRHAAFLLVGLPLQAAGLVAFAGSWLAGGVSLTVPVRGAGVVHGGRSLPLLAGFAVAFALLVSVAGGLTALQRRRFRRWIGVTIPESPAGERLTWAEFAAATQSVTALAEFGHRLVSRRRWGAVWRQLCYHVLAGPAIGLGSLLALAMAPAGLAAWGSGAALAAAPPVGSVKWGWNVTALGLAGMVALLAAPWLIGVAARLDIRAATALLGPSRATALAHRVEALTESRAGVVDAADAERRRIERDLHDGAQQRLVSLAMNLGIARESLTGLPDDARRVIEDAHQEAKAALTELRNLVRGLHPAILEDRGLDAALPGIASLVPVPVRLRVDVPGRLGPTVEAVAYFIVSEALANITKHARASRADVEVTRSGDILRVRIADDGVGGADPAAGTGLAGLARRAGSVDGSFHLSSPPGGPTEIVAELPCGL